MRKYILAMMLLSMALAAAPAHAANYFCTGNLNWVSMGADGTVWVAGPGGLPNAVNLCNVNTTASNNVQPQVCKSWYALLLAADLAGQQVGIDFSDSLTCSTQPTWTGPASVYHVHKQN
jgi:hypothetical protein